jgi:hypothetical protein
VDNLASRIWFFVDADYDRVLSIVPPSNVTLTDGRDLESYALFQRECLEGVCTKAFARDEGVTSKVRSYIRKFGLILSAIRLSSIRQSWRLPVQKTLEKKGLGRFITGNIDHANIDVVKIIRTLIQNSAMGLGQLAEVVCKYKDEYDNIASMSDGEIIHGKDLSNILAWYFSVDREQVERIIFSCINYEEIRRYPNISSTEKWVRASAAGKLATNMGAEVREADTCG